MLRTKLRFMCCKVSTVPLGQAAHHFWDAIRLLIGRDTHGLCFA